MNIPWDTGQHVRTLCIDRATINVFLSQNSVSERTDRVKERNYFPYVDGTRHHVYLWPCKDFVNLATRR